jgi:hypothetical protein
LGDFGVKHKQVLTFVCIAFLLTATFSTLLEPVHATGITLVHGPDRGTASILSGNFQVILANTPTSGNLLILTIYAGADGYYNPHVTRISQTGVTWTVVKAVSDNTLGDAEIWKGVIGSSAGTAITISIAGGSGSLAIEIVDVCEWSGLDGIVDKTAENWNEGTSGDSGTTATTTQNDELAVAAIGATSQDSDISNAQSNPTNSFTQIDGASKAWTGGGHSSLSYLYKILSSTSAQNTGVTIAHISWWVGVFATFTASAGEQDTTAPSYGTISANTTLAGNETQISCTISDSSGISAWGFAWNNTGSWVNAPEIAVSGTSVTALFNGTWASNIGDKVSVQFWSNDTLNNAGYSSIHTFTMASPTSTPTEFVFSDGFESGWGVWTYTSPFRDQEQTGGINLSGQPYGTPGTTWALESSIVHSGSYAAKFTLPATVGAWANVYKSIGYERTLYMSGWFMFDATIPNESYFLAGPCICGYGDHDLVTGYIYNSNGALKWCMEYYTNAAGENRLSSDLGPNIQTNVWYNVQVMVTVGNGNGEAEMWVMQQGQSQFTVTSHLTGLINDGDKGPNGEVGAHNLQVGPFSGAWVGPGEQPYSVVAWYDDTFASTSFLSEEDIYGLNYTLTIQATSGGSTNPAIGEHEYSEGTEVELVATPSNGYSFVDWEIDGVNQSATATWQCLMNDDHTAKAYFIENTYVLTIGTSGSGSVNRNVSQPYRYGQVVRLTAEPEDGWSFGAWSGGISSTTNPYDLTVTANLSITASFTQYEFTLSLTITNPTATTYTSNEVPVSLGSSGNDSNPAYSWNVRFSNGTWLYGTNKTGTSDTITINENVMNAKFCCYVVGKYGASDYKEVTFNVQLFVADTYTLTLTVTNPKAQTYTSSSIPVSLSASGNDTNPAYSWNVKFTNGTWLYGTNKTSTSYTITLNGNITNANFCCKVLGTNRASDYKEVTFSVQTRAPDFSLTANPTSLTIRRGRSGTSRITVNLINNYAGSPTLSATGAPAGMTISFSKNPVNAGSYATMTINVASLTSQGTYTVTIKGTDSSAGLVHTTTVRVTVSR